MQILSVKAVDKYNLQLVFSDGTEGVYDAGHLAGKGIFKAWDVNNNFEKVFIDENSGAVTWPEEIDIDTVNVYCKIKRVSTDYYLKSHQHAPYMLVFMGVLSTSNIFQQLPT